MRSLGFTPEVAYAASGNEEPTPQPAKPWWPLALAGVAAIASEAVHWAGLPTWLQADGTWQDVAAKSVAVDARVRIKPGKRIALDGKDDLPALRVLADGIGQCNTKGTLVMALPRAVGVACRLHGFTIDKALQEGAITGLAYQLAPHNIIHSWVEVWSGDAWLQLEGFILDRDYLTALQKRFASHRGAFCGFGAATPDLRKPGVDCVGAGTYIQTDGINQDFGLFDSPDDFYAQHGVNLSGLKRWLLVNIIRQRMNHNVARIRSGG